MTAVEQTTRTDTAALQALIEDSEFLYDPHALAAAQAELASLVERNQRLVEALRVLADIPYQQFNDTRPEHILMAWNHHELTIAHVIAARAAIGAP